MKQFLTTLILDVCFTVICSAQSKTYTGTYEFSFHDHSTEIGQTTYSYNENLDGSRSFQGPFKFKNRRISLKGSFNANKQVGKWVYKEYTNFYIEKQYFNGFISASYNFIDGKIDGPISIQIINSKNGQIKAYCNVTVSNNKLVGQVKALPTERMGLYNSVYHSPYHHKLVGSFNNDGSPIGEWIVTDKTRRLSETYNDDGSWSIKYINTSTGDPILEECVRVPEMANIIIEIVNYFGNKICFRDSERIEIPKVQYSRY